MGALDSILNQNIPINTIVPETDSIPNAAGKDNNNDSLPHSSPSNYYGNYRVPRNFSQKNTKQHQTSPLINDENRENTDNFTQDEFNFENNNSTNENLNNIPPVNSNTNYINNPNNPNNITANNITANNNIAPKNTKSHSKLFEKPISSSAKKDHHLPRLNTVMSFSKKHDNNNTNNDSNINGNNNIAEIDNSDIVNNDIVNNNIDNLNNPANPDNDKAFETENQQDALVESSHSPSQSQSNLSNRLKQRAKSLKSPKLSSRKTFFSTSELPTPITKDLPANSSLSNNQPNNNNINNANNFLHPTTSYEESNWKKRLSKLALSTNPNEENQLHKWKEFKHALSNFGKQKKDDNDPHSMQNIPSQKLITKSEREVYSDLLAQERSNHLISTLLAGCPASLYAFSVFLDDEHDTKRAPLLLSLLGIQVYDITQEYLNRRRKNLSRPYHTHTLTFGSFQQFKDNNYNQNAQNTQNTQNNININNISGLNNNTIPNSSSINNNIDGYLLNNNSVPQTPNPNSAPTSATQTNFESKPTTSDFKFIKNRKFKIFLEYGVGPDRVKWSIIKDYKEIENLQQKFKIYFLQNNTFGIGYKPPVLPKFPKIHSHTLSRSNTTNSLKNLAYDNNSGYSIARDDALSNYQLQLQKSQLIKTKNKSMPQSQQHPPLPKIPITIQDELNSNNPIHVDANRLSLSPASTSSSNSNSTTSSSSSSQSSRSHLHRISSRISSFKDNIHQKIHPHLIYETPQGQLLLSDPGFYARKIENYFKELNMALTLRPQSNRLFQFYELSPISVLLSYEIGYVGKQGLLLIRSSAKSQGWRVHHFRARDIKAMYKRHTTKWFLVRNSYIMYVADINSTTPLEVFLVDSDFQIKYAGHDDKDSDSSSDEENDDWIDDEELSLLEGSSGRKNKKDPTVPKNIRKVALHFNFSVMNSERKLKMFAASKKQLRLWIRSIKLMQEKTIWSQKHRFNSFAPVRHNCFAQWFVDGRDYFWAASSAILMAKDTIFIHDWWLTPELYLRRPANGNEEYRIDRLLKRKAEEGVKIFVIVYRNLGEFVVTDSLWTKHSLMDLHDNIRVIRSPNQFLQNTFFWAHHEKLLIIDQTVAFLGGIDLCFGRYDTPDHVLVDDSPYDFASNLENISMKNLKNLKWRTFPGKDYSNPRVKDFTELDKPHESMYDRKIVPRMPWHDVHMFTAGQIARDLSRHFVQRWNYLLRQKRPSRPTPLLLPPSDLTDKEIAELGFKGTNEIQLLRSSASWSLGLKDIEQSIQNAYLKLIETSEHFVYIENQFFVTACAFDNTIIENRIGDALVDRIIRAHKERTPWRAVIIIPLMPGFESQVDESEGSSLRVIIQCQYMSISRGSTSIFAKLRKLKIEPNDYIQFFSLRKWGRIGPYRQIVSEQLYIHAKTMIVDDRVAIIGSANINERSMRGNRDSEVAAIVRDTDTVKIKMAGKPYIGGRFAHSLRVRLMREHLGIDVDVLDIVERKFNQISEMAKTEEGMEAVTINAADADLKIKSSMVELAARDVLNQPNGTRRWKKRQRQKQKEKEKEEMPNENIRLPRTKLNTRSDTERIYKSFNNYDENEGIREYKQFSSDPRITHNKSHRDDVSNYASNQLFKKSKILASTALKNWAIETMAQKNDFFLPNYEKVIEFLEDDGFINQNEITSLNINNLSTENKKIILEKDEQRWEMLKRISYLQRVAAKQNLQEKEEAQKKLNVGIMSEIQQSPNGVTVNASEPDKGSAEFGTAENMSHSNSQNVSTQSADTADSGNHLRIGSVKVDPNTDSVGSNGNIPITHLEDDEIKELLSRTLDGIDYKKFVDPYGFDDPLDEDFYEDVWFDIAESNTKLFRLVFHCQPDDTILTWNDYKEYSDLSAAFKLVQDQEAEIRKELNFDSVSLDDGEEVDEQTDDVNATNKTNSSRPKLDRNKTYASIRNSTIININDLNSKDGLIGAPPMKHPPENNSDRDSLRRKKVGSFIAKRKLNQNPSFIKEEEDEQIENKRGSYANGLKSSPATFVNQSDDGYGDSDGYGKMRKNKTSISPEKFEEVTLNGTISGNSIKKDARYSSGDKKRRIRTRTNTFGSRGMYHGERIFDRETAEKILSNVQGNLVLFPVNWLANELESNNWFTTTDRLPPIEIYD
ncbi:phospholipase D ASCRUDRAFT_73949 [Ascoidea rubescens DSM 1968]|uniref:Phospholipase D1 n=1 Tax=Ascoidea rubescens DSM 1968 TaxID=1344418 RepID=A0A1D2VRW0_9ASCO|nr:hypothetical protein ASCRUDRAFT_73949 [Ascoidea rubescens DSM 1968]ODV64295.1 hypothetical protein ASCRUDRAFT_73949 [Ascoidea rubescens DSM 1968]